MEDKIQILPIGEGNHTYYGCIYINGVRRCDYNIIKPELNIVIKRLSRRDHISESELIKITRELFSKASAYGLEKIGQFRALSKRIDYINRGESFLMYVPDARQALQEQYDEIEKDIPDFIYKEE